MSDLEQSRPQARPERGDERTEHVFDVAVIGAGPAGCSAATALSRFRRSVIVIDDGHPRNADTGHVHNFPTRDGITPAELMELGLGEAARYGTEVLAATVERIEGEAERFVVHAGDRSVHVRRIVVATGGRDELPDVPGLAERWGIDVVQCPFCHGYELREQHIGVLATGPMASHQAKMFRLLTPRVTLLGHIAPLARDQVNELTRFGIAYTEGVVVRVDTDGDALSGVELADGRHVSLEALAVTTTVHARAELLAPLGLHPTDSEMGGVLVGTRIDADPAGATEVPGVRVTGNVADPAALAPSAAASGFTVAAALVAELATQLPERPSN